MPELIESPVAFYLGGRHSNGERGSIADLSPALFAYRRDLTALRYDFPLVLVNGANDATAVGSLSTMVDAGLTGLAERPDADRLRHHAHALEQELRRLLQERGGSGKLGALRAEAMERLGAGSDDDVADSTRTLAATLPDDAELLDCDGSTASRVVTHLWEAAQRQRLAQMRAEIDRLILRVSEILAAAEARSDAARSPDALRAAIGNANAQAFDFAAFSRILAHGAKGEGLSQTRAQRLQRLLSVLQSQRFFAVDAPYEFSFTGCGDALRAWRERLPAAIELLKAITIAELEIAGEYDESRHDPVFATFGSRGLDPVQAARFPSYLVRLDAEQMTPADVALTIEALDAGLPVKVLLQTDDILAPASLGDGISSLGLANRRLTGAALALGNVFVMQASAAQMFACRQKLYAGLTAEMPALISVFSAPYLLAAAAVESRAFPSFAYDPAAGPDMASRVSLDGNPQPDRDWPQHDLSWEDPNYQRGRERIDFTLVDLLSCDRRFAGDFAPLAPASDAPTVSVADCVTRTTAGTAVPHVMMVDGENRLHKVVADERLIRAARRCLDLWHGWQEWGGIHNSHAARAVHDARAAWDEATHEQIAAAPSGAVATEVIVAPAQAEAAVAEPERSSDEPYIETARCSSCNECVQINAKMFAYNNDKQAYIVDPAAGTYRELVEAAESCQVAIIHPGKPRNPNEPGLEELLARAAAFA